MLFLNTLTDEQRQALQVLTQQAVGRVANRAWMILWSAQGVSVPEIAQRLDCRAKTVRKWLRRYQRYGCDGLFDAPRPGRPSVVTEVARQAIFTQINQSPGCFGYLFAIWTVATLCTHLATRCALRLHPRRVRAVLHELRYRFRRPKIAPRRTDPEREAIHQQIAQQITAARQENPETVTLVQDESDFRLFPVLRRMWMRIGQPVQLPAPLKNQKRTLFGVLNPFTGDVFCQSYARKRTIEMIAFLEAVLAHYIERPILLILDHASIHKSKALMAWLALHPQIKLVYLPKYAAHRDSPIEKLWWYLKGQAAANRCCRSIDELMSIVQRHLSELTPERVLQLVARKSGTNFCLLT